jgi:hypothetical protein
MDINLVYVFLRTFVTPLVGKNEEEKEENSKLQRKTIQALYVLVFFKFSLLLNIIFYNDKYLP